MIIVHHYPGWQCWIGLTDGCLRYVTANNVILTLIQWKRGYCGGLDLLIVNHGDMERGLLCVVEWEVWSLLWFNTPAFARAKQPGMSARRRKRWAGGDKEQG